MTRGDVMTRKTNAGRWILAVLALILCLAGPQVRADDDEQKARSWWEQFDELPVNATTQTLPDWWQNGDDGGYSTYKTFRLNLPESGRLTVRVSVSTGGAFWFGVYQYGDSNRQYALEKTEYSSQDPQELNLILQKGYYFVEIGGLADAPTVTVTTSLESSRETFEKTNLYLDGKDIDKEDILELGKTVKGQLSEYDRGQTEGLYKLTLTQAGRVTFSLKIKYPSKTVNFGGTFENPRETNSIGGGITLNPEHGESEGKFSVWLGRGTYHLEITDWGGTCFYEFFTKFTPGKESFLTTNTMDLTESGAHTVKTAKRYYGMRSSIQYSKYIGNYYRFVVKKPLTVTIQARSTDKTSGSVQIGVSRVVNGKSSGWDTETAQLDPKTHTGSASFRLEKGTYLTEIRLEKAGFFQFLVNDMSLVKEEVSLKAGKTHQIKINNLNGRKASFQSSNKKVATVNAKGVVTALKKGKAKITVKVGDAEMVLPVTVTTNPKLSKTSVKVREGESAGIKITGKAAYVKNVYTNTKTAKVTSGSSASSLKIKGLKAGTATLKIRVNGVTLKCKVTVTEK